MNLDRHILTLVVLFLVTAASTAIFAQARGAAGAIVAIEEAVGGGPQQGGGRSAGSPASAGSKRSTTGSRQSSGRVASKPTTATPTRVVPKAFNGPVLGDKYSFLNFEVVDAVKPVHTNAAKAAGAKGLVQVEILVETDGRVISAHARTGNKLLWPEAERAALGSRLDRPTDNGRAARALGFLVYRFGPGEDDD